MKGDEREQLQADIARLTQEQEGLSKTKAKSVAKLSDVAAAAAAPVYWRFSRPSFRQESIQRKYLTGSRAAESICRE